MVKHYHFISLFALILATGCLAGCSKTPTDQLEDYLIRISRVLDVDLPDNSFTPISRYSVSKNKLPQRKQSIGLLEYLRISQCQLGQVVGYKNSQLGKVAAPSQRLHFERDMLIHAQSCIESLQDQQSELAKKLEKIIAIKQQQRMHTWWNAWSTGKEWQQFGALSADAIEISGPYPAHLSLSLQALDYALSQGHNWLEKRYEYQSGDMVKHLQQLLLGESLGRWRKSMIISTQTLERAADMLVQRLADMSLCPHGVSTPKAEILHNVFLKIYVGRVQPYLSRTDQFGDELLNRLNEMAELAPAPRAHFDWISGLEQQQRAFDKANMRHVKAWQNTLEECGLMPSSSQ